MAACVGSSTGRDLLRDLWSFEEDEESAKKRLSGSSSCPRSPNPLLLIQTHDDSDSDDDIKAYGGLDNGLRGLDLTVSPSASMVLKEGWLVKRGHNWHTWKTRWFVLYRDARLVYYKNPKLRRVKGCVRLDDGIVKVQFADTFQTKRPYCFQVVKGYYVLLCSSTSRTEADAWVHALRRVRSLSPSDTEGPVSLTSLVPNEAAVAATLASAQHARAIERQIELFILRATTTVAGNNPLTPQALLRFVSDLETQIMQSIFLSSDATTRLAVRYYIEDKVFLPLIELFYAGLTRTVAAPSPAHVQRLRNLPSHRLNPTDVDWSFAINSLSTLDTVSLPSHKLWVLMETIAWVAETLRQAAPDADDAVLQRVLAYVVVHAAIDDLAGAAQLLQWTHEHLPRCGHDADAVHLDAFICALAWLQGYTGAADTLAIAVTTLPFSTPELGLQLSAIVGDRGARVAGIKKHSQASLCPALCPDLVLLGINETLVAQWTLADTVDCLRAAALPKRLVFVSGTDYEKLVGSPDFDAYLACVAASRGDLPGLLALVYEHSDGLLRRQCRWDRRHLVAGLPWLPPSHDTPLHAAVVGGHAAVVAELLDEFEVSPVLVNAAGQTPLHVLRSHVPEIAPALVAVEPATLNAPDPRGCTPLMLQCSAGNVEGVVTLLGLGADLRTVAWASGTTALAEAVVAGHADLVDLCLLRGANVRHANLDGDTPLHLAARTCLPRVIERLIAGGAVLTAQNRLGQSPAAVLLAHPPPTPKALLECLALLATPATLELADLWGRHLVHIASQLPVGLKGAMELLLLRGANGHAVDLFGDTPREYRKHSKDHGAYVPPTAFMRHLNVTLVQAAEASPRLQLQSGRVEDLFTYLIADKSMRLSEMLAFVLNCNTYTEPTALLALLHAKLTQNSKGLKKAWSVANFQRDPCCGAAYFLVVTAYFFPTLVASAEFSCCWELVSSVPIATRVAALERYYRGPAPTPLYADLYDHMTDMYGGKPQYTGCRPHLARLDVTTTRALDFARQCTLVAHAVFAQIPIRELLQPKCAHKGFLSARHWFQHLSALVINYVLAEETPVDRARVVGFFIDVAEICFESLQNFDTFVAILYALQSTAIFRLKRTMANLPPATAAKLTKYQVYTQNGSRDMNRVMKTVKPPCMPYLGLYLQNIVGLNELPKYEEESIVNFNRLRLLGSLAQDLLSYQSTPFPITSSRKIEELLHVDLAYTTDEARFDRSHAVESRSSIDAFEAESETPRRSSLSRDSIDSTSSIFPRLRFSSFSSKRDRTSSASGLVWV
ncbi:hypothetical protein ACHHYP_15644 [Achlya hypogyna]|uniref:Ras-specific guanine nucleotide-releasing factor n=1 Tax=Achlya hypogyna TaxID=1202772 RepID=A0A1V9YAA9_ACHHY|nr:hypothetical protein ACHHYP_15644 [Achlya hypogyna]